MSALLAIGVILPAYGVQPLMAMGDSGHHSATAADCEQATPDDVECNAATASKADCCKVTGCHSPASLQSGLAVAVDMPAPEGAVAGRLSRLVGSSLAPPDHPPRA